MGNLNKTIIAVSIAATLTGCQNWGGVVGAGGGGLAGNAVSRAVGINPIAGGILGAIAGGALGDSLVNKWRMKDLPADVKTNITKLLDETHDAFAQSMNSTKSADDAELVARASPDDKSAHSAMWNADRIERDKWNAYTRRRDQFTSVTYTAMQQGYDVSGFKDSAGELMKMEQPIYQRITNRRVY